MNVLNLPALNKQPSSVDSKPRLPPSKSIKEWNNRIKTIKVSPTSNGGAIQLQSQYGVKTYNEEEGGERKRETVPPLSFPPVPLPAIQQTERPSYYKPYSPYLDDIFPSTPSTYIPPPTPRTTYKTSSIYGYTRTAGEIRPLILVKITEYKVRVENKYLCS